MDFLKAYLQLSFLDYNMSDVFEMYNKKWKIAKYKHHYFFNYFISEDMEPIPLYSTANFNSSLYKSNSKFLPVSGFLRKLGRTQ